jgi:hypothetical protein
MFVCVCIRVIHNVGRLCSSCPMFGQNRAQVAKQGIQAKISLKLEPWNTKEHKFMFFKQASWISSKCRQVGWSL